MVMLGEFGEFLLWMGTAYFQLSVSRDPTTASSNAFTENNDNQRKKGASATQSSNINLRCCIRLLTDEKYSDVSLKGAARDLLLGCFNRGSRGAVSTPRKLSWLLLSLQIHKEQGCRQTNCKDREAEYFKITWHRSKGF